MGSEAPEWPRWWQGKNHQAQISQVPQFKGWGLLWSAVCESKAPLDDPFDIGNLMYHEHVNLVPDLPAPFLTSVVALMREREVPPMLDSLGKEAKRRMAAIKELNYH